MHPVDFAETVGAFTAQLTHMFVPVKSAAAVEMLVTVAEDTIQNMNCSDGLNWCFFFIIIIGIAESL